MSYSEMAPQKTILEPRFKRELNSQKLFKVESGEKDQG